MKWIQHAGLFAIVFSLSFASSCSRKTLQAPAEAAKMQPSQALPSVSPKEVIASAQGYPYQLRLQTGILEFCDNGGRHRLNLATGESLASGVSCPKPEESGFSCDLPNDMEVQSPLSQPNDVLVIGARSVPLNGRVHDCAKDGSRVALITANGVDLIDSPDGALKQVAQQGGQRVAMGSGWIAWADGQKLHALPIKP